MAMRPRPRRSLRSFSLGIASFVLVFQSTAAHEKCNSPSCFEFTVDWASGSNLTTFPTAGFGIRKVEAFVYPADGYTYAYSDIVNYTCANWTADPRSCPPGEWYYPASFSSQIGVFSSPNGYSNWTYHGVVLRRGKAGDWDGAGVASPGAAVAADGTVLLGYSGEDTANGSWGRAIGMARASHPLGPFIKDAEALASPSTICKAPTRCGDIIMQTRPDGVHLYHSVKHHGSMTHVTPSDGIRHTMTRDGGKSWSNSTLVLTTQQQPGTWPHQTIAGKFFPQALGGLGGMVLISDACAADATGKHCLHAYVSKTPGSMVEFVASSTSNITAHPPISDNHTSGSWANLQMSFFTDSNGTVASVGYGLWDANPVKSSFPGSFGMSMTVFSITGVRAGRPDVAKLLFDNEMIIL